MAIVVTVTVATEDVATSVGAALKVFLFAAVATSAVAVAAYRTAALGIDLLDGRHHQAEQGQD